MKRLVLLLALVGCEPYHYPGEASNPPAEPEQDSSSTAAMRALEDEGYENIRNTGVPLFRCSDDDSMFTSISFEADRVTPHGTHHITGVVCCGLVFKGCTIRH